MKVYLAASYVKRVLIQYFAELLELDGHTTTSEWVSGIHEHTPWTEATYSRHDLECIDSCDLFMGFTEPIATPAEYKRGGRHVEFGYALAKGKRLVIVGPRENAFYYLPRVEQYDTFELARRALKQIGLAP